jgi:putative FmdB family regulatory protein
MIRRMPTYEFRCRSCGQTFTEARPMSESRAAATCPQGHDDTVRLLNVGGVARSGVAAPSGEGGGGCCGGGCCA